MKRGGLFCFLVLIAIQTMAQNDVVNSTVKKSFPDKDLEIIFHDKHNRLATAYTYDKSGNLMLEENYSDINANLKNGYSKAYYSTGEIYWITDYKDNDIHGEFRVFYPTGILKRKEVFKRGTKTKKYCYGPDGQEVPYYEFISKPSFKGDSYALQSYLRKYVKDVKAGSIGASTIFTLNVEKDSTVKLALYIPNEFISAELMNKIVDNMQKWNPASYDGIPFSSSIDLRLVFLHGNVYLAENVPNFNGNTSRRMSDTTIPTTPPPVPNRQRRRI